MEKKNSPPYQENMVLGMPNNNYGYTKLIVEQLLEKLSKANDEWSIALLRYFNPVGAHKSAQIGEDPQANSKQFNALFDTGCSGMQRKLSIFGQDYPTDDGTCERDFIHVVDLAKAHVLAVEK